MCFIILSTFFYLAWQSQLLKHFYLATPVHVNQIYVVLSVLLVDKEQLAHGDRHYIRTLKGLFSYFVLSVKYMTHYYLLFLSEYYKLNHPIKEQNISFLCIVYKHILHLNGKAEEL